MHGIGFAPELQEQLRHKPVRGTPYCELKYTDTTRTHKCTCLDGSLHEGERDLSSLVGGSEFDKRLSQCNELLIEFCGDTPEGTNVECESASSQGFCSVWSSSFHGSEGTNQLSQDCFCADGRNWSTEQFSNQGLSLSEAQVQEACQAQVKICEPGSKLDPTSQDIVLPGSPENNEHLDTASCQANFDPSVDEMESLCELFAVSEKHVMFNCGCGVDELPLAGLIPRIDPSRKGLVSQCNHILKQCDPKSHVPRAQPNTKPDACEDAVRDAVKSMSCAVDSGIGSYWYGLLGLAVLLRTRKKRIA